MIIERLTVCEWTGGRRSDTEIDAPSWSDVEAAVRELNNRNLNDIYLCARDSHPETFLAIGGGAGQYIVSGAIEGEVFPTVIDPERSAEPRIRLMVGGQLGDYPGNYVIGLESALLAAKSYYDTGSFDGPIKWVNV